MRQGWTGSRFLRTRDLSDDAEVVFWARRSLLSAQSVHTILQSPVDFCLPATNHPPLRTLPTISSQLNILLKPWDCINRPRVALNLLTLCRNPCNNRQGTSECWAMLVLDITLALQSRLLNTGQFHADRTRTPLHIPPSQMTFLASHRSAVDCSGTMSVVLGLRHWPSTNTAGRIQN